MAKLIIIFLLLCSQPSFSAETAKWEIRTAPVAFLASWLTLDLSYFLNEHWAFGPSYIDYANKSNIGNMFLPTLNGTAFGAHLLWAESFFADSIYAGLHFYNEKYDSYVEAFTGHYEISGTRYTAIVGKRWLNGYNTSSMLGIGWGGRNYNKLKIPNSGPAISSTDDGGFLEIEFKLGYYF